MEKLWEIWCDGYETNGNSSGPQIMATQSASTFDEAITLYMEKSEARDLFRRVDDYWLFWGCRLYDKNPREGE